jgi:hypothetical protein
MNRCSRGKYPIQCKYFHLLWTPRTEPLSFPASMSSLHSDKVAIGMQSKGKLAMLNSISYTNLPEANKLKKMSKSTLSPARLCIVSMPFFNAVSMFGFEVVHSIFGVRRSGRPSLDPIFLHICLAKIAQIVWSIPATTSGAYVPISLRKTASGP